MLTSSALDALEDLRNMGRPPRGMASALGNLASWATDVLWVIEQMAETDWSCIETELDEAFSQVESHRSLLKALQALVDLESESRELVRDHRRLQTCAEEVLDSG